MQKPPLVSIGFVTYNRAHYLRKALDCWLNQTFTDFELILSDDATTDETEEICREYAAKDSRIRYFRQPMNLNQPLCFKFVLTQARGTYFVWAQDDDLWDIHYIEKCLAVFREHPEYALVFTDMVDIDKHGNPFFHPDPANYMPLELDTYKRLKQYMLFKFQNGRSQLMVGMWRREIIDEYPLFGPEIQDDYPPFYWGFENYFNLRSFAKGPAGFVPETLFFRRSRVLEGEYKKRAIGSRVAMSFYHRARKIFVSPYFGYVRRLMWSLKTVSRWERVKLVALNYYVMARVFIVRTI